MLDLLVDSSVVTQGQVTGSCYIGIFPSNIQGSIVKNTNMIYFGQIYLQKFYTFFDANGIQSGESPTLLVGTGYKNQNARILESSYNHTYPNFNHKAGDMSKWTFLPNKYSDQPDPEPTPTPPTPTPKPDDPDVKPGPNPNDGDSNKDGSQPNNSTEKPDDDNSMIIIIAAVAAVLVVVAIGVTCYCKKIKAGKADTADGENLLAPPKSTTIQTRGMSDSMDASKDQSIDM